MEWYVFRYNINSGQIERFNIFNHYGFSNDFSSLKNKGYDVKFEDNLLIGTNNGNSSIMVVHPLWSNYFIDKIKVNSSCDTQVININDLTKNMPINE